MPPGRKVQSYERTVLLTFGPSVTKLNNDWCPHRICFCLAAIELIRTVEGEHARGPLFRGGRDIPIRNNDPWRRLSELKDAQSNTTRPGDRSAGSVRPRIEQTSNSKRWSRYLNICWKEMLVRCLRKASSQSEDHTPLSLVLWLQV